MQDGMQKIKESIVSELVAESCTGDVTKVLPYQLACLGCDSNDQSFIYELRIGCDCRTNLTGKVSLGGTILTYFPIMKECFCTDEVCNILTDKSVDIDQVWDLITRKEPLTEDEILDNINMYKVRQVM